MLLDFQVTNKAAPGNIVHFWSYSEQLLKIFISGVFGGTKTYKPLDSCDDPQSNFYNLQQLC